MSEELERLPLFPLNLVLFPHAQIQLHIFEERYRSMVRDCLEAGSSFGIVLIRSGEEVGGPAEPYMVGTKVAIANTHFLPDGKIDITVTGQSRFRIRRLDDSLPYLVGYVEPVRDERILEPELAAQLVARAREGFIEFLEGLFGRTESVISVSLPEDPEVLSFVVATFMPVDNLEKQRLLEGTDTLDRLEEVITILESQLSAQQERRFYRLTLEHLREWVNPN